MVDTRTIAQRLADAYATLAHSLAVVERGGEAPLDYDLATLARVATEARIELARQTR